MFRHFACRKISYNRNLMLFSFSSCSQLLLKSVNTAVAFLPGEARESSRTFKKGDTTGFATRQKKSKQVFGHRDRGAAYDKFCYRLSGRI